MKVIEPEATTNLITNPSVERNATGWTAIGDAGFTDTGRTVGRGIRGAYGYVIQEDTANAGDTRGVRINVAGAQAATRYTVSFDAEALDAPGGSVRVSLVWKDSGGVTLRTDAGTAQALEVDKANRYTLTTPSDTPANTDQVDIEISYVATGTASVRCVIDGVQLEAKAYATTYCDGSQAGCTWAGTPHGSTSGRDAQSRAGGRERDFEADFDLPPEQIVGFGAPALTHITQELAVGDGALLQGVKAQPTVLTVRSRLFATDDDNLEALHAGRRALLDVLKPDRTAALEPFVLIYDGSGDPYEIDAVYVQGLEGDLADPAFSEELRLQFVAYEPRWRRRYDRSANIAHTQTVVDASHLIERRAGRWRSLGEVTGTGPFVEAIHRASDGRLYIGGVFTAVDGVAAANIAVYDPASEAWAALGSGTSAVVHRIKEGPDGKIYAVGNFGSAGGNTDCNAIAAWDAATESWESLSTGFDAFAWDLDWDHDGNLYAVGHFSTAGGVAARRFAKWDGATWAEAGGGLDADGTGILRGITTGGRLYLCGDFTADGTGSGDLPLVAIYDPATDTLTKAGDGLQTGFGAVGITQDSAGRAYVVGNFPQTGSGAVVSGVARLDGNAWRPLGAGITLSVGGFIEDVHVDDEDNVYVVGTGFRKAGAATLDESVAVWNGSSWGFIDADLPGTPEIHTVHGNRDHLWFGYDTAGGATTSAVTTVTNAGSSDAYPVMQIAGPGHVKYLRNWTSGVEILMDVHLAKGERLTIDFRPGQRRVSSDRRGDLTHRVLPASHLGRFSLVPGDNRIALFVDDATAETESVLWWRERHWGAE